MEATKLSPPVRSGSVPVVAGEIAPATLAANVLAFADTPAALAELRTLAPALRPRPPARFALLDASREPRTIALSSPASDPARLEMQIGSLAPQTVVDLARRAAHAGVSTALYWNGVSSTHDALLLALGEGVGHLATDTARAAHPAAAIADLDHFRARLPQVVVTDLAWERLRPWRAAIDSFFTHASWPKIIRAEVRAGNGAQSLYFAAWLARRFGWTAIDANRFIDAEGTAVHVIFENAPQVEGVASVRLRSAAAEFSVYFSSEMPSLLCAFGTNGRESQHLRLPFATRPRATEVIAALAADATDEEFRFTLPLVRDLEGIDE